MFEITRLKMIDIIHQCMDEQIRPGDTVCDCTMGNGHDTAYMCRLTGDTGTVYSFDIQPEALSRTEALLAEEHLLTPARLILDSHSHLKQYIDHPIRFFVFNLGYLPDGDPTVITKGTSTLEAIEAGEMQGTVYNDKEDQALQIAKLAVEVFKGEHQVRKELKEGRYYVSQYQQVDSSNAEEFLDR